MQERTLKSRTISNKHQCRQLKKQIKLNGFLENEDTCVTHTQIRRENMISNPEDPLVPHLVTNCIPTLQGICYPDSSHHILIYLLLNFI